MWVARALGVSLVLLVCLAACENKKVSNGGAPGGAVNAGADVRGERPALAPLSAQELQLALELTKKKCNKCHKHDEQIGLMKSPGFKTTQKSLPVRISPEIYDKKIEALKSGSGRERKFFDKSQSIIEAIQAESSIDRRVEMWLHAYLNDPKFDHPKNRMARVALGPEEIDILARYIMHVD